LETSKHYVEKMSEDKWLKVAAGAFLICVLIFLILYLKPRQVKEDFSTVSLGSAMPKCLTRSMDAQELYALLKTAKSGMPPASDAAMAFDEMSLILQKLLCMDADITSYGAGTYSTMGLPFNTHHDMEPVGSFVGRCLKNAVQPRDIELTLGKLHTRGNELIRKMCHSEHSQATAFTLLNSVVAQVTRGVTSICLKPHAAMDIPPGVRDPGYYASPSLQQWSTYTVAGTN
jgi:hypothetical protein